MLIVLADDVPDVADTTAAVLRTCGRHTVEVARDGPSALTLGRALKPDAMVLDIGLPGIDGYEVAKRVRLEPWGAHILLIALTGYGELQDIERAAAAGFDVHRVKPVEPDNLLALFKERSAKEM